MNKVIPAFICVAFILMLTGCKKKKFNDAIYDTIGQKIEMDIHKQDPTQFTILRYIDNPPCTSCQLKLGEWKVYYKKMKKMFGDKVGLYFLNNTKLLQKSEMRKNMVMDLIYRGFINAANYSESHYNPRRSQIKTELRYLFVTTPNR